MTRLKQRAPAVFAGLLGALFLMGCTIHTSEGKDASGKNEDVDIRTPFGSLSVKNGKNVDAKDTGLPLYPGAHIKDDSAGDDHDNGANINLSSSMFGLKVVALKFQSGDSPDKVLDFYRKQLGKYGKVIQCAGGDSNSNFNARKEDRNAPVSCGSEDKGSGQERELKAGTQGNQHVVSVKPQSKGTEFALVYVRIEGEKDTM